jgi:dipeptidyl aminopeptidase/acylaminoacyl peptidase
LTSEEIAVTESAVNMRFSLLAALASLSCFALPAQVPDNLLVEGIPPFPMELKRDVGRYLEFRAAAFQGWHPERREMLIATRFADTPQLHLVKAPGGARRQLTFAAEPSTGGLFRPRTGQFIVFSQDVGGGEFYQLYRLDLADGRMTLLTDGKSRNQGARWSRSGQWLAYTSTRRNGKDNDIYLMNPADPKTDRLLLPVQGGGWSVQDWSWDEHQLLLGEYISINEAYLHLVDIKTGALKPLAGPRAPAAPAASQTNQAKVAIAKARFDKDGRHVFLATDESSEFLRLVRVDLTTREMKVLTGAIRWGIEDFDLSPDATRVAVVANEDGASVLRLLDARTGRALLEPKLPRGVVTGLDWHENGRELGFSLTSARSPSDAYSLDARSGRVERWTESETGGLNPEAFVEPELVRLKSFDALEISAWVHRPDPKKFPGPRPVLISIHGGPEAQARPIFQARNNYYLNELGVAVVHPNVRGSDGWGKTFLTLDNGFKREDSVKDIGALIGWVGKDPRLDRERIGVMGGSYGGYMVLATMIHFGDQLRCGVDVVGISSFLTFLKNTQDYRRDLRRAEYGDERDPAMEQFLARISPMSRAAEIRKPLFVVQGLNDPRVPASEAAQMIKAIRGGGGQVWSLLAKDEGHGFAKKKNADFQFLSTILFWKEHLLR